MTVPRPARRSPPRPPAGCWCAGCCGARTVRSWATTPPRTARWPRPSPSRVDGCCWTTGCGPSAATTRSSPSCATATGPRRTRPSWAASTSPPPAATTPPTPGTGSPAPSPRCTGRARRGTTCRWRSGGRRWPTSSSASASGGATRPRWCGHRGGCSRTRGSRAVRTGCPHPLRHHHARGGPPSRSCAPTRGASPRSRSRRTVSAASPAGTPRRCCVPNGSSTSRTSTCGRRTWPACSPPPCTARPTCS